MLKMNTKYTRCMMPLKCENINYIRKFDDNDKLIKKRKTKK